ncbi:solute carrier family 2, facilitated glucose transporter member 8 isoform X3 [Antechinus flavipes]|uniref:solute carrier family 2, facilitated glucose transporter member 8 isoform X3 n=1 Tax=Antechinus flavipes TaxID=38775 RepID=UPI002236241E|nr:solute carrier family 2, facilitated glucose transporter member 8 isoform X3 [Antechinus flavipes]
MDAEATQQLRGPATKAEEPGPSVSRPRGLFLAAFAATLGALSFGFVLGYSSPAIPSLRRVGPVNLQLDKDQASWFGSLVTVGGTAGGIVGGLLLDKAGRKLSLMLSTVPFVGGFALIIGSQNIWMLYGGRILNGLAGGIVSLVVPVYVAEISYPEIRGRLGSCGQVMLAMGIFGAYAAGLGLEWCWLAVLGCVPPFFLLLLMCFMPETPRFLMIKHKQKEAKAAMKFLWGIDHEQEVEEKKYNHEDQDSSLASVIVGVLQVVFTAIVALLVDKAGRKLLLVISGTTMSLSCIILGVYFKISLPSLNNSSNSDLTYLNPESVQTSSGLPWLAVFSVGFFLAGFSLGWGPIPWLLMSEIFPLQVKGLGSGVCVFSGWMMAFLVTKEFSNLMVGASCDSRVDFYLFLCLGEKKIFKVSMFYSRLLWFQRAANIMSCVCITEPSHNHKTVER